MTLIRNVQIRKREYFFTWAELTATISEINFFYIKKKKKWMQQGEEYWFIHYVVLHKLGVVDEGRGISQPV